MAIENASIIDELEDPDAGTEGQPVLILVAAGLMSCVCR